MRLFVSQVQLDEWVTDGTAQLAENKLAWQGRSFELLPAVHFIKLVTDAGDPHDLLGKIKTERQLDELGAEHYMDSVLLGEVGYEVRQGFVGELVGT